MDSQITTDLEGIIDDTFFSELITHNYPTDETENLRVIWYTSSSLINENVESELPYLIIKTSDMTNIDRKNSTFVKDSETYKIHSVESDHDGLTRINLTQTS